MRRYVLVLIQTRSVPETCKGGTRLTVQTGHTSFLFIILPFTLLTLRFSRRSRDSIDRLIPICPPTIDLLSVPPSMISPFLL